MNRLHVFFFCKVDQSSLVGGNFFIYALVFAKNSKKVLLLQKIAEIPYFLVPLHLKLRGTLKSGENLSSLYPATWTCGVLFHFF